MNTDLLREQAYLVERGVRAIALAGICSVTDKADVANALAIAGAYSPGAVPFILLKEDGLADYGYGASRWAIDLYAWALGPEVPSAQSERIFGLLFGYSAEAIERFETRSPVLQESYVPVVDGSMAVGARGELIPDVVHVNDPVRTTIRRIYAHLSALVAGFRHSDLPVSRLAHLRATLGRLRESCLAVLRTRTAPTGSPFGIGWVCQIDRCPS
ncbi:MAG: hypothetical protein ABSH04_06520 [Acidimicrobiales bacterium]|jgi:hypothetical protein